MKKELLAALFGILLSALGIVFGDQVWSLIGINDPQLKGNLTLAFTILSILSGFLITYYLILGRIDDKSNNLINEIKRSIPQLTVINQHGGMDGLKQVAKKLIDVSKVYNTRIIPNDYEGDLYFNVTIDWNNEIVKAVKDGLIFYDIVSGKGKDYAEKVISELEKNSENVKGRYNKVEVTLEWKSFLNFKILYFKNETTEVWFGWRISDSTTIDETCYSSSDKNLIGLFEDWYHDLLGSGKNKIVVSKGYNKNDTDN